MPSVGEVCSQPGIITAVLVLRVFGDIGDGAAVLAAQTKGPGSFATGTGRSLRRARSPL